MQTTSFVIVNIGAYGRQSDGSVFANSLFGRMLKAQQPPIPPPELLGGSVSFNLCRRRSLSFTSKFNEALP